MIAFTGRLVPEKGVAELLEAARLLEDERDIHFLFAGDGPLLEDVETAPGNVHALGRIVRSDIAALLLQADIFCLPTRSEGFSTSLLEATVCGCSPIITNVGGVAEMIPNESYGIVLPNAEPHTLALAISELKEDPGRRRAMAEKVQRRATNVFTWKRTAQTVMEAFERAAVS